MWKTQPKNVLKQLEDANKAQDEIILKIQTKKNYLMEDFIPMDFTESTHIQYTDNVFVRDLSTDEQTSLGVNMFHVKIYKTTSSPVHEHASQSQLIHVKKGSIYDKVSKVMFGVGESYFISRKNKHSIKYLKGAELIMTYMPGLDTQ